MHQIMNESEDVTLEFYHKKAVYTSPITGGKTNIDIKTVYKRNDTFGRFYHIIISTNGIRYHERYLTF